MKEKKSAKAGWSFAAAAVLAAALVWPGGAGAYERYNDGCQSCHGNFTGSTSPKGTTFPLNNKHEMHRGSSYMATKCNLCHTSGDGNDPFTGSSNGTAANPGLGCTGCHEKFGLRAHHAANGITACGSCHLGDGTPPAESTAPTYYGTADTKAANPCNPTAQANVNENWSVSDFLGIDNDGDNLYDGSDPDCTAAAGVTITLTPDSTSIPRGGQLGYTIQGKNDGAATECVDFWTNVTLPNQTVYPPTGGLVGPKNVCLPAGANKSAHLSHQIVPTAPTGAYRYNAYTGTYPTATGEDHFDFTVTP